MTRSNGRSGKIPILMAFDLGRYALIILLGLFVVVQIAIGWDQVAVWLAESAADFITNIPSMVAGAMEAVYNNVETIVTGAGISAQDEETFERLVEDVNEQCANGDTDQWTELSSGVYQWEDAVGIDAYGNEMVLRGDRGLVESTIGGQEKVEREAEDCAGVALCSESDECGEDVVELSREGLWSGLSAGSSGTIPTQEEYAYVVWEGSNVADELDEGGNTAAGLGPGHLEPADRPAFDGSFVRGDWEETADDTTGPGVLPPGPITPIPSPDMIGALGGMF